MAKGKRGFKSGATGVTGIDTVMSNLNEEIKGIENRTEGGLMAAGLKVQRRAQEKVPVDTGDLRASAYTQPSPTQKLAVEVGFSSGHALYVHENIEQKWKGLPRKSGRGVYWGPHGEPKFLESSVTELSSEIVDTVAQHAEIKPGARK